MARVSLEGVSKVYPNGQKAVDNLDLEIRDREFLVLVGPSGCGKTTTLRMIAGLETPTSGKIAIGERVVNDVAPKDRDIAMVFQSYALYPHMSVYKNMAFGLELRFGGGLLARVLRRLFRPSKAARLESCRRTIKDRVRQAAELLGIEHLLGRMPRLLSGGERQRVALGRAIVREPAAFLFDEPLSNLDAKLRVEMRRELKRLHRELNSTVIHVTHDQVEALTLGQRVVVMKDGQIQQIGRPLDVYQRPKNRFVAGFIGSPPMSFVEGVLQEVEGISTFVGSGVRLPLHSSKVGNLVKSELGSCVTLGVRPEDVFVEGSLGTLAGRFRVSAIEPLGDSKVLDLEAINEPKSEASDKAAAQLQCKVGARESQEEGDLVDVRLYLDRLHVFSQAGENLTFMESK
jgi:ABC-type sugar transport system ATPase subunit